MAYKVILFDHDDTLVQTLQPKWAQHKYIAQTYYNKNLSDDEIRRHWGKPFSVLLQELYGTDDVNQAVSYNINTRHNFPKILFPETLEVLQELQQSGIILGLITATSRNSLEYDFATLNIIEDLFEYTQTQEDSEFHKPDPRVFKPTKVWLTELGYSFDTVLYIGDALTDMRASQSAGFQFMSTCTGLVSEQEFKVHGINTLNSLRDLLPLCSFSAR